MRVLSIFLAISGTMLAQPPKTRVQAVTETIHGVTITDPYRWLEDQDSPETRAWIDSQMSYTESALAKVPQRERIRRRLGELMKVDSMAAPSVRNGRYFIQKRKATENQYVVYTRESLNGADELLLDPNPISEDHTTSAVLLDISHDGSLIAYGLRQGGVDETTLRLRSVPAKQDLPDRWPPARYFSVSFKHDLSGLYYVKMLNEGPRLYYHTMGSDTASDKVVFGEKFGATYGGGCDISENGRWLYCQFSKGSSADVVEVFAKDLSRDGPFVPLISGIDARFDVQIGGDRMYAQTNWKAPNGRIIAFSTPDAMEGRAAPETWQEVVPERASVMDSFSLIGGRLIASWLENVHSKVEVFTAEGKPVREIVLPSLGIASGPYGHWDSNESFYYFNSFGQPQTIYRYDVADADQSVWFRAQIPFDPSTVEVKQVWYASKDGTKVPMFIAYKKGLKLDGSHPALLTGYGGFNLPQLPVTSATALAWLDLGGVYALANLRGGGEFGEAWHKAGMLDKKQNVFDDFIAAAEYLIREKYTRGSKLAIWGGSNGGLLVGAALTQRPDLFQAVVCVAPLLDMVRYDQFKVAKFWVPEYGSAADPEQFKVLYKYSPYHHVDKGAKYPAVMLVTGDADTRVDPLHARKMAARLEASTGSGRPVLLHYDTKAGHSAGLPVDKQIETTADELAFLVWQLGIK
jgi:prolyl oligopeptidase